MIIAQIHYSGLGGVKAVADAIALHTIRNGGSTSSAFYGDVEVHPSHVRLHADIGARYRGFRSDRFRWLYSWVAMAAWLIRHPSDVIICHSLTAILPALLAAKIARSTLIVVEHTPNQSKSRAEWIGSAISMRFSSNVVFLNNTHRDTVISKLSLRRLQAKARVIPNGVDISVFHPKNEGSVNPFVIIGMAARFSVGKRQDLLVRAFARLPSSYKLVIAGRGPRERELKRLSDELCIPGSVQFVDISPPDMAEWFRSIDIYAHASDSETFSTSVLQAMATGLPVLASDIPGMRDLIEDSGILVSNSIDDWESALLGLTSIRGTLESLGERARRRVVDLFSSQRMFDSYARIIESHTLGS